MNASRTRFDHPLHQFKSVQGAAESRFGIGNQRSKPGLPRCDFALCVMYLVCALQRIVDAPAKIRNAVRRVQTLVGIHSAGIIRIRRDLPSANVDRFQPSLHLLHRLVTGHGAERVNVRVSLQQFPQTLRAHASERVLNVDRATQAQHIF